jgi:hypothetical protein
VANDLVNTQSLFPAPVSKEAEALATEFATSYLPRIQLVGSNSNLAKEGKVMQGAYALVFDKENCIDLTKQFDTLVIDVRPKAMKFDGSNVMTFYEKGTPQFQAIQAQCDTQDSGCMAGPEVLLYIPSHDKFATYFMSSKTARKRIGTVVAQLQKAATFKSELIKSGKFSWFGPVCVPCSTPLAKLPTAQQIADEIGKFRNPPAPRMEPATSNNNDRG